MPNKLIPVAVPWKVSPSISGIHICIEEDGDCVVRCEAYSRLEPNPWSGRVSLLLGAAGWVRTYPLVGGRDTLPERGFDSSALPNHLSPEQFVAEWVACCQCPDPGVYQVAESLWLAETNGQKWSLEHFVVSGRDMWFECLSRSFAWEKIERQPG